VQTTGSINDDYIHNVRSCMGDSIAGDCQSVVPITKIGNTDLLGQFA
jgi:hypothetical protein